MKLEYVLLMMGLMASAAQGMQEENQDDLWLALRQAVEEEGYDMVRNKIENCCYEDPVSGVKKVPFSWREGDTFYGCYNTRLALQRLSTIRPFIK